MLNAYDCEFDVIELSTGCVEQCSHCSEAPRAIVRHAALGSLLARVEYLRKIEDKEGVELFCNYWLPFPSSDPFLHPKLFDICDRIWQVRGLQCYLLSLGWGRGHGSNTLVRFIERPSSLLRVALTVSNFSALARINYSKHRERLAQSLRDLIALWNAETSDGRPMVVLSPQFVSQANDSSPFSESSTMSLLEDIVAVAGLSLPAIEADSRLFPRPITGLGNAISQLGITDRRELNIVAETPAPSLSRNPHRRWSGLVTVRGEMEVVKAPRGLLGRERDHWRPFPGASSSIEFMTQRSPTSLMAL